MTEVVIIAEATARPGKRDQLRKAIDVLVPESLAEDGVDTFRLHEDRDQPGRFVLYERFYSQEAIDAHFATKHFADISAAVADLAEGGRPKITYYQVLTD